MQSPQTLAALQSLPSLLDELAHADLSAANVLSLLTRLRKTYSPELAAAALETAQLRQKARAKFPLADQMFFTSEALQQATPYPVAQYHADLLADCGCVVDLGCSIGGDAIAIGQKTAVIGLDLDLFRLQMARHHTVLYKAQADFIQADLTAPLPLKNISYAFFDPARRADHERIFSIQDYLPPLSRLNTWGFRGMLVKISPGVKLEELAPFRVGIEFVSYAGDLKECLLHSGEWAFEGFRATNLSAGETLLSQGLEAPPVIDRPLNYIYEPDPAVIRSGLFGELLHHLNFSAYRLDESIAYLTSDDWLENPWLRGWRVDAWMPFNLKKIRAELVKQGIGRVTVKKRGSPISPEEMIRLLNLKKGTKEAIIFLTQLKGQPITLISYLTSPKG